MTARLRTAASALTATLVVASACRSTPADQPRPEALLDGRAVHYVERGSGEPAIVLVHGWCCDSWFWRPQLEGLAEHARVVAVDLPGHGMSAPPARPFSMDLYADAIASVLDALDVRAAVLVGHSNGVPAVRQFYRRYPQRTRALVLVDGLLRPWTTDEDQIEALLDTFRGEGWHDAVRGFAEGMPAPTLSADQRAQIVERMLATPRDTALGGLEASFDRAIWTEDPIDVPVLCLMARAPYSGPENEELVRRLAPRSEYRVVDGVGHFVQLEAPEVCEEALLGFLARQGILTALPR